ncbi:hypothetical protein L3X38_044372 [Prunus dulcis]|uniref:Uncharacterized protein n=1 Tax=Prunus dulcis TaxID=3755 RepID=A0AAD4V0B7_PRUDU|nr:hypothetical protein L3X38_044372 [Prunus dulcis]
MAVHIRSNSFPSRPPVQECQGCPVANPGMCTRTLINPTKKAGREGSRARLRCGVLYNSNHGGLSEQMSITLGIGPLFT